MSNPWLNPLRRSYQSIKTGLLEKLRSIKDPNNPSLPLVTDTSEGNILNVIISSLAGVAEMIHVYIDNLYRESFLTSATRYDSVVNHLRLIDYHPAAATASEVYVTFSRSISNSNTEFVLRSSENYTVRDSNGNTWVMVEDLIIPAGVSTGRVKFRQHVPYNLVQSSTQIVGGSVIAPILGLNKGSKLEQGWPKKINIQGIQYIRVDTLAHSGPDDRHFVVESSMDGSALVRFGDGKFGKKPTESNGVPVNFGIAYITEGSKGNIEPFAISGQVQGFSYSNSTASSGGTDYEDFNALKFRAPLSVKTQGVAITKEDFLSLARMVPGVIMANIEYVCGQDIKIYILGYGASTENEALCSTVKEEISQHIPYGTKLTVLPISTRNIQMKLDITGNPSYSKEVIKEEVINALYNAYNNMSPYLQVSTTGIRISDLYALLDNLVCIDYLTIVEFYITPWLKPLNTAQPMSISYYKQNKAKGDKEYLLSIVNSTNYIIYPRDNKTYISDGEIVHKSFMGTFGDNVTIQDDDFEFTINVEAPSVMDSLAGLNYSFSVYEGNKDIEIDNYYVPRIDTNNIVLNIHEVI